MNDFLEQYGRSVTLCIVTVMLSIALVGYLTALDLSVRAEISSILLNLVAALFVACIVACALAVGLRVWHRSAAAIQMTNISFVATGVCLIALLTLGAATTRLRLASNMRVQVGADFVFVGGTMGHDLSARLAESAHPSVAIDRIVLSSSGGSVPAAIEAANWLKMRGVRRAVIEGDCASACALLALLMPERYLTPGAALGFHELWGRNAASSELRSDRAEVLSLMRTIGIDTGFIEPLMVGRELQYPDRAELLSRRIVTGCWSQVYRAPEPCTGLLVSRAVGYEAR